MRRPSAIVTLFPLLLMALAAGGKVQEYQNQIGRDGGMSEKKVPAQATQSLAYENIDCDDECEHDSKWSGLLLKADFSILLPHFPLVGLSRRFSPSRSRAPPLT